MEESPKAEIVSRIAAKGKVSFAEFMEVALYHPTGGYYVRQTPGSAGRDYYTSPTAHPSFGALIAVQLHLMWELLDRPTPFHAIEMGAGAGHLARDVADYARRLPGRFTDALRYMALDRTVPEAATDSGPPGYRHVRASGAPLANVVGCFLSNELLDAFPVHRFQVHEGAVKEVFVAHEDERFSEVLDQPSSPLITERVETSGVPMREGDRGEVTLAVRPWVAEVAAALHAGFVLTIDFAHATGDVDTNDGGSLQTYHRHTSGGNPYEEVGTQDIAAAVDFRHLVDEGVVAGLRPVLFTNQGEYLRRLGMTRWLEKLRTADLTQRERDANMLAMRDLVKPDGLGGFKVLVQEKGTGVTAPEMLVPSAAAVERLEAPLLRPDDLRLLEARYPHAAVEYQEMWPTG